MPATAATGTSVRTDFAGNRAADATPTASAATGALSRRDFVGNRAADAPLAIAAPAKAASVRIDFAGPAPKV